MCNECVQSDTTSNNTNDAISNVPNQSGDAAFWSQMNNLLDSKFKNFEQTFKDSIMGEVKQITDPISVEVDKLKKENKQLKTEITLLKTKDKEQDEKLEKVEKALKEHQKTLAQTDKGERSKRLILAGMPEEDVVINDMTLKDDREKAEEVLRVLNVDVPIFSIKRIGKKDQGAEKRPRYLMLDFRSTSDRNQVKVKSKELKEREDTKMFYLKADLTKKTRDEYKRLHGIKQKLIEENPEKAIKIEYGKLYVDEVLVDQIVDDSNDFL